MSEKDLVPLGETQSDRAATAVQALAGQIPVVGPLVQQVVADVIPNRRMERLERFVLELENRVCDLEGLVASKIDGLEHFELFERAFEAAARASSPERRGYVANIMVAGFSAGADAAKQASFFLNLLSEIDDAEVLVLLMYHHRYNRIGNPSASGFMERYKDVVGPFSVHDGTNQAFVRHARQLHLASKGLLVAKNISEMTDLSKARFTIGATGRHLLDLIGRPSVDDP